MRSKNFTVVGNAGEKDMRKLATKLEQFRHVISILFPKIVLDASVPTTVVLFKNHDSFRPFKPRYKGKIKEDVGGYFFSHFDGNHIVLTNEVGSVSPLEVIYHEYQHAIMRKNMANSPPWLNEGLAEFYRTFETRDGERKVRLGAPIGWHLAVLKAKPLLPLKTLFTVDHKSPHYNESDKAGIFYAQSWALVHYLMLGNQMKRQEQLNRFIAQLSTGISLEDNFRQSFQTDYQTIEDELRKYIHKFMFPVIDVTLKAELDFDKDMQSSTLSEAETQYHSGELLMRRRQFEEAEKYLQKAVQLDPNLATAFVSLGISRMNQSKPDEAEKFLQEALKKDPHDFLGNLYYASILRANNQPDEAVKIYKQLAQLNPDAARVPASLAATYVEMGQDDHAVEAYTQALKLDPRNTTSYRSRSYAYMRLARGNPAATDAFSFIRLQGWRDDSSPYMALIAYFGYRRAKRTADSDRILNNASSSLDTGSWPFPVVLYLQKTLTAEQLLAQATDNDKLTEAHAYLAYDLMIKGAGDEALRHFQWVKENGNKNFVEYHLALAELARLESSAAKPGQ